MEKEQKKTREREANWSTSEKELLRECISMHLEIVEHKGNDTSLILKKKNAWKSISETMASAGYKREIPKLKAQWVRMKVSARKAMASMKRASFATGNSVVIPEISAEDKLVHSMIINEFQEDDILIDRNCVDDFNCVESPTNNAEYLRYETDDSPSDSEINFAATIENSLRPDGFVESDKTDAPIVTPLKRLENKIKKQTTLSKLQRLRRLYKTPSKNSVILERQRQIAKQTTQSEELNKMQIKKLNAEFEHVESMHKLQKANEQELHSLKVKELQTKIRQDEELHAMKLNILRGKVYGNCNNYNKYETVSAYFFFFNSILILSL